MQYQKEHSSTVKTIYEKPIANTIVNKEKLASFSLLSGMREGYPLALLLSIILLKVLVEVKNQKEETKGIKIQKEVKQSIILTMIGYYILQIPKFYQKTPRFNQKNQQYGTIQNELVKITGLYIPPTNIEEDPGHMAIHSNIKK